MLIPEYEDRRAKKLESLCTFNCRASDAHHETEHVRKSLIWHLHHEERVVEPVLMLSDCVGSLQRPSFSADFPLSSRLAPPCFDAATNWNMEGPAPTGTPCPLACVGSAASQSSVLRPMETKVSDVTPCGPVERRSYYRCQSSSSLVTCPFPCCAGYLAGIHYQNVVNQDLPKLL